MHSTKALHFDLVAAAHTEMIEQGFQPDFPVDAIAELLGVSAQDVRIQKWRGRLKGYDPVSVREYLLRISRQSLAAEIRRQFAAKLSRGLKPVFWVVLNAWAKAQAYLRGNDRV